MARLRHILFPEQEFTVEVADGDASVTITYDQGELYISINAVLDKSRKWSKEQGGIHDLEINRHVQYIWPEEKTK